MSSSSHNGGDSSPFDPTGQQPSSYTSVPSFGPSLHQQRLTHHDQNRNYVPKLAIPSAQISINYNKTQNPTTDSQIELITALKIRIAVLENELAHAARDKDEAIKSSVMIARALGSIANPKPATRKLRDSDIEELEELRVQVKRLRRNNGMLWDRIESREANRTITHDGSAKTISRDIVNKPRPNHPIIDAAIKKINFQNEFDDPFHPVDFNKETQLPNIVNLERHDDGSMVIPSGFPALPSTQRRRTLDEINNATLDQALESDDEVQPEVKIEDQLLYQERANANFINVPPPAVLKAGFELSPTKAIRGDDYANRGYANRNSYYARFNNRNAPGGARTFEAPPDLSQGPSIWTDQQQRDDEITTHMRCTDPKDHKFPDYFRYGVVYVPGEDDHDTLRGVHIGGLPKDIELRDVLARVRGGRIYSSVLLNTMAISGSNSAIITFIHQDDAEAYVKYANDYPITFGCSDSDEEDLPKVVVTHIHTPTFPFSPGKHRSIFELNRTRSLTVLNFPQNLSLRNLEFDLGGRNAFRAKNLVEWYIDEEANLKMEFASMDAAGSAFGMLASSNGYRQFGLALQFERDNCEGDLEELEKPLEKRKPMFPRLESGASDGNRGGLPAEGGMGDYSKKNVESVLVMQRRRLAMLQKQHDVIPSSRDEGSKSGSWADEVIEDSGGNTTGEALGNESQDIMPSINKVPQHGEKPGVQTQQTRSSTGSASTLIDPSIEAPGKDEDANINPTTPIRAPRIISGKQWLLELTAAEKSSTSVSAITSTSTPIVPNPPASTPASPDATPRPRLKLATTSLPPTITTKSPDPSSAEYSLHSFASSAVDNDGDDSPEFAVPNQKVQGHVQDPSQIRIRTELPSYTATIPTASLFSASDHPAQHDAIVETAPLFSAADHPVQLDQTFQYHSTASTPALQALKTFQNTTQNADTKVYFELGGDTEKAILDSEVSSQRGGDRSHYEGTGGIARGVSAVLLKEKIARDGKTGDEDKVLEKINPDEIDLGGESDVGNDAGDENDGLFQKELMLEAKTKANTKLNSGTFSEV